MLTTEPTQEMIKEWKGIFDSRHTAMSPDRKSGAEVDAFFRDHYSYQLLDSAEFRDMVAAEIMENDFLREKLPEGALPDIRCYTADDVMVGIDINSGEFHVESEDIDKVVLVHDDLFVYRGLDEKDLSNFFLVAEYVKLTEKQITARF